MPTEHMPYTPYRPPTAQVVKKKTPIQTALGAGAVPLDPAFQALTPAQQSAQASSSVRSQVDPIIGQITDAIQARSRAGANAIGAYTGHLQSQLAPMTAQTEASYNSGVQGLAGMSQQLADRLAAAGHDLGQQTTDTLAASGQNTAPAAGVAQFGNGLAATTQAAGNADANALRVQGLASTDYARALPGIAGLGGLQRAGDLQQQLGSDLADQTGKITAQVPGLLENILAGIRSNELSKAGTRQDVKTHNVDARTQAANDAKARADAETKNKIATILTTGWDPSTGQLTPAAKKALTKLGYAGVTGYDQKTATKTPPAPKVVGGAGTGYYTVDPTTGTATKIIDPAPKTTKPAKRVVSVELSKQRGVLTDTSGNEILKGGKPQPFKKASPPKSSFTPEQVQHYHGLAVTLAEQAFNGAPDSAKAGAPPKGDALPKLTYPQAVLEAEKEGIPPSVYLPVLNRKYQPGARGRPATKAMKTATKSASDFFDSLKPAWSR